MGKKCKSATYQLVQELLSKRDIILNDKGKIEKVIKEHLFLCGFYTCNMASDGCFEDVF